MKKLFKMFVILLVLLFNTNIFAQVSFSAETEFTVGVATTSLTNADVNGDGKQDIIATRLQLQLPTWNMIRMFQQIK